MTYFRLISALLLTLPACVLDKDLGDTPEATTAAPATTTGTTDHGETTNPTEPGTTDPTATTGAPAQLCPNSDEGDFTCTVPYDCQGFPCGGLRDSFDADGCPRPSCYNDGPCPEGQVCFDMADWGACNSSGVFCEDFDGTCGCGANADCSPLAHCVPAEIGPPADCFAITDATACLAAGCSEAPTMIPVTVDGDTCVCGEPETACLWFAQGMGDTDGSPGIFFEIVSNRVVVFPGNYIEPPMGWLNCEDLQGPPACACAEACGTP